MNHLYRRASDATAYQPESGASVPPSNEEGGLVSLSVVLLIVVALARGT
jgi:hypothetical protein